MRGSHVNQYTKITKYEHYGNNELKYGLTPLMYPPTLIVFIQFAPLQFILFSSSVCPRVIHPDASEICM